MEPLWSEMFNRAIRTAEEADRLVVEVDFSAVEMAMRQKLATYKPLYCGKHDWDSGYGRTPCAYCKRDQDSLKTYKHTPKQRQVICQLCNVNLLRYWGDKAYTCGGCLTEHGDPQQHEDNLTDFFRELDS